MKPQFEIEFTVPPLWDTINKVRQQIAADERVQRVGSELTEATVMVASELLENAIKYGYHSQDLPAVQFTLRIGDEGVRIIVTNAIQSRSAVAGVIDTIEDIRGASDPEEAYTRRLRHIAENPRSGASGLGFYRMAYEGGYTLDYDINDDKIAVAATRLFEQAVPWKN